MYLEATNCTVYRRLLFHSFSHSLDVSVFFQLIHFRKFRQKILQDFPPSYFPFPLCLSLWLFRGLSAHFQMVFSSIIYPFKFIQLNTNGISIAWCNGNNSIVSECWITYSAVIRAFFLGEKKIPRLSIDSIHLSWIDIDIHIVMESSMLSDDWFMRPIYCTQSSVVVEIDAIYTVHYD